MKKSLALMLALIMVLCMIPTTALAKSNSTVVLHPSVNHTVTGVKVKVGDKIDGHSITKISGYDITVDLGTYNVNNGTFRLPYAKDIWEGVDNNKVDYISWAGSGSNKRSEGASALLANGKNTAYYYFKGAPTLKTFTLNYDANGGTGAPATQTYTATSQYENSHTFTISSKTPTREGYEFKGWAESLNDTAATRQPGGSIVVTGTTTLYAVWGNHEHKDKNGDGYCDTDHECMHEKDQDGYCTVDGCTHPHEGDGACCPKKSDNKPERPEPEDTSKPFIELTGEKAVKVHCTNDKANHDDKIYGLMHDGYTVGEVQGDKENGYACEITVEPAKYVAQYNSEINVEHKLDPESQIGKIKLKWKPDNTGDNTGSWEVVSGVPVVFDVKCDNTQPPLDNITIEVSKTWHDDSNTVPKPDKITVLLLADGKEVDRATIPDVNGAWSHSFGAKPANDNGKPINYTVKEENVPDWTPYYYTAGLWKGKLIFQIHNVPTKNTREIKVTKTVSGEGADKAKYFDFKVTLLEYHDNAEVTYQPGYYPLGGTYTFGGVTFTNGVATFKLKDGDSKEITGIPTHIYSNLPLQYKVEEIAPSGYTVKVNDKAGNSINGDFAGDKTVNIAFENVKESGTNPTPTPTPTSTPGGGNGGGGHWHPTTTPVPVIVIPPKTGDMTIWQSILHFLGIR